MQKGRPGMTQSSLLISQKVRLAMQVNMRFLLEKRRAGILRPCDQMGNLCQALIISAVIQKT